MSNFEELKTEVERLVQRGDLKSAIQKCRIFLDYDDSREAIELLEGLEKRQRAETSEIINSVLNKTSSLWANRDFEKLNLLLLKLNRLDPGNKRVENEILRLRREISATRERAASSFNDVAGKKLKELWDNGDFEKVLIACGEIIEVDPTSDLAAKFEAGAKNEIVMRKIEEIKKEFYAKKAFRAAISAFKSLGEGYGFNKLVINAMQDTDKLMMAEIRSQQNHSIVSGLTKVNEYLSKNNISDARLVLQQLEAIDSEDRRVISASRKIEARVARQRDLEIVDLLRSKLIILAEDFQKNPDGYLAI